MKTIHEGLVYNKQCKYMEINSLQNYTTQNINGFLTNTAEERGVPTLEEEKKLSKDIKISS